MEEEAALKEAEEAEEKNFRRHINGSTSQYRVGGAAAV